MDATCQFVNDDDCVVWRYCKCVCVLCGVCLLRMQDRTLVDDDSQGAVIRRSFNQFDEEGMM